MWTAPPTWILLLAAVPLAVAVAGLRKTASVAMATLLAGLLVLPMATTGAVAAPLAALLLLAARPFMNQPRARFGWAISQLVVLGSGAAYAVWGHFDTHGCTPVAQPADAIVPRGHRIAPRWSRRQVTIDLLRIPRHGTGSTAPPAPEQLDVLPPPTHDAEPWRRAPYGLAHAELDGVVHPSLSAWSGRSVVVPVQLPDRAQALRWYDGGMGEAPVRRVRIWIDGVVATQSPPLMATDDGWEARSLSVEAWGGREVEVEFAVEGEGLGLFGAPRVVTHAPWPRGVLVVLVESLRADWVGTLQGGRVSLTPTLDALGDDGVVFDLAVTPTPDTKPMVTTLLTGLAPETHHVGAAGPGDRLPVTVPTLPGALVARGWRTAAFSASPVGLESSGLTRGFDTVVTPFAFEDGVATLDDLGEQWIEWIDEAPDQPWFAWVHAIDLALPSDAQEPRSATAAYGDRVRTLDARLASWIDELRARGLEEDVLVAVTSDGGMSFGDHGAMGRPAGLWQSQIHVPWILWGAGAVRPTRVHTPVSLLDLPATLNDVLGLGIESLDGASLRAFLEGRAPPMVVHVPSSLPFGWTTPAGRTWESIVSSDLRKLVVSGDEHHAFHLGQDACEAARDLLPVDDLWRALEAWREDQAARTREHRARHGAPMRAPLPSRDIQLLRRLEQDAVVRLAPVA